MEPEAEALVQQVLAEITNQRPSPPVASTSSAGGNESGQGGNKVTIAGREYDEKDLVAALTAQQNLSAAREELKALIGDNQVALGLLNGMKKMTPQQQEILRQAYSNPQLLERLTQQQQQQRRPASAPREPREPRDPLDEAIDEATGGGGYTDALEQRLGQMEDAMGLLLRHAEENVRRDQQVSHAQQIDTLLAAPERAKLSDGDREIIRYGALQALRANPRLDPAQVTTDWVNQVLEARARRAQQAGSAATPPGSPGLVLPNRKFTGKEMGEGKIASFAIEEINKLVRR